MDGFHYYKKELNEMKDPQELFKRRGAPFTFNSLNFFKLLKSIKDNPDKEINAPSFDHSIGDPIENDIKIYPKHDIIIIEGNYLFLQEGNWKDVSNIFDYSIFIDIDIENAMNRVKKRHIECLKITEKQSEERIKSNDYINALLILETKKFAKKIFNSIDDFTILN
jgi:pantothenate kinase